MSNPTTEQRLCDKQVSQDGWHWNSCGRPAKYLVRLLGVQADKWTPRCGTHARKAKERPTHWEYKPV